MNEQGFYKSTGVEILYAPNYIQSPNYYITINDKDTQSFPLDGWYYFDTKQEAESFFQLLPPVPSEVGRGQIFAALIASGLFENEEAIYAGVDSILLSISDVTQRNVAHALFNNATVFKRNHSFIEMVRVGLNKTNEEIDKLFILAETF